MLATVLYATLLSTFAFHLCTDKVNSEAEFDDFFFCLLPTCVVRTFSNQLYNAKPTYVMNYEKSVQQSGFDYSQVKQSFPPQDSLFTNSRFGGIPHVKGWPVSVENGQQSVPQGTARTFRPSAATEHTKHRRTRNGCYTCRQRRVKVGFLHPNVRTSNQAHYNYLYSAMRAALDAQVSRT